MEVLAKKLVNQKYCSIKDGPETNITNLRMDDITVHKEIALYSVFKSTRRKSPATFNICVGYFLYSKVLLELHVNDVAD